MTGWQAALLPKPFRAWGSLRALPWLWTQISSTSLSWVAGPSAFQLLFSGKRKKSRASHFLWSNWEGGGCVSFTHVPSARTQSYGHMPLQRNQEYSLAGQPCAHKKDNRFGVREHASKPSSDAIRFLSLCSWKEDFRSHTGKSFHLTSGQTKGGLGLPLLLLYDKPSQISWHKMCHYVHAFYVQESRKGTVGPACSSSWGMKSKGRDSKAQSNSVAGAGLNWRSFFCMTDAWSGRLCWQECWRVVSPCGFFPYSVALRVAISHNVLWSCKNDYPANMAETALPFMIYPWKSFNIISTTFFVVVVHGWVKNFSRLHLLVGGVPRLQFRGVSGMRKVVAVIFGKHNLLQWPHALATISTAHSEWIISLSRHTKCHPITPSNVSPESHHVSCVQGWIKLL